MSLTERDLGLANRVGQLFTRARNARQGRVENWRRNYRLVQAKQWSEARSSYSWMPAPTASEIYPILRNMNAWMSDQRLMSTFTPEADPGSPYYEAISQISTDLNHVMESLWVMKDWDAIIEQIRWDAFIYGTGFLKGLWDPAADDGKGNPTLVRVDPFTMYPDPMATSLSDANYLIEGRTISLDELERRFPGSSDQVESNRENLDRRDQGPSSSGFSLANPVSGYQNPSAAFGRPGEGKHERTTSGVGTVDVLECWWRENETYTNEDDETYTQDHWRVVVVTGDVVLMDERASDLWEHGRHPYSRYILQDLGEFWGMSLVDHLASPQIALNRILAAMQNNAELLGNPILKESVRAGIPRTKIVNRAGQRLQFNDGGTAEWMQPPPMPPILLQMAQLWMTEMEKISGMQGAAAGKPPSQRSSTKVAEETQESSLGSVRSMLRSMERTLNDATAKLASLVVENYTTPRYVALVGPEGEQSAAYLQGRHFYTPTPGGPEPLRFQVKVEAGGGAPTSRQARSQRAHMLFALGVVDDEYVLEADDVPNRKAIIERKQQKMQAGMHQPPGARQKAQRST